MITIIDYGMGNLHSVQKAFELFCRDVRISSSAKDVRGSDKIVLPGVGAFKKAMHELDRKGLSDAIRAFVEKKKPFLGVCLGFQLIFSESEEGGRVKGLDILKGKVRKFNADGLKIPHMGWNRINFKLQTSNFKILKDVQDGSYVYFVHSYYAKPEDRDIVICETEYGANFASGIQKDNIHAFQFHPEKSQKTGLKIVKNFAEL